MLRPKIQDDNSLRSEIDLDKVVDIGDGPETVLFLHGLFGTPDHWHTVMQELAGRYRVVAPQLPIDPHPDRRVNGMREVSDLREAVVDLIEKLELEDYVICGNSLGGLIAIDYCVENPGAAAGMVLAGSAGLFERSPIRGLRSRPNREWVRSTITGILHDHSMVTDEMVDQWHHSVGDRDYARFLLRVSRATRDRCVEDDLAELQLPTLIIWGRNDTITPPETGKEFQRKISGSQLEFIEDCGHAPNWERPHAFAEILQDFLPTCFAQATNPS